MQILASTFTLAPAAHTGHPQPARFSVAFSCCPLSGRGRMSRPIPREIRSACGRRASLLTARGLEAILVDRDEVAALEYLRKVVMQKIQNKRQPPCKTPIMGHV